MAISIEIICMPCSKCADAERKLRGAIKALELQNKTRYPFTIRKSADLSQASRYSASVAQTPFVIVNGTLEWAGRLPTPEMIKMKMRNLIRSY